ncbi:MAG: deoxyguanosinetriphosphate triphosphohydrolase, partial [Clostridia bacterium]|nr:deoxyguanosinetriphosphate triphosphohydrolase [Clostridia bacterium]
GDHYRTRLTHTLEVMQVARTISRALRLNEDLTEAISLGHDLGHTPFGHSGENILNKLNPSGFEHNKHSLRVVELLENDGEGLNLTFEVKDGIVNHKKNGKPSTLEGKVVSFADRIAYVNHDIEDAISGGIITENDIPKYITDVLGDSKAKRINTLVADIVQNSYGKDFVAYSEQIDYLAEGLRNFMFDSVYHNPKAKSEEIKANKMIEFLFEYFMKNVEKLPAFYIGLIDKWGKENAITDYIASMTDTFAIRTFQEIFVPNCWNI